MKRFQDLDHFSEEDIEAAMTRNDAVELRLVSVTVALAASDCSKAQAVCVRLCSHPDAAVRGNALISLGHLARRFRSLDERLVKPLIERALRDDHEYVRANAKAAADEIHQFLHWQIEGHVYG